MMTQTEQQLNRPVDDAWEASSDRGEAPMEETEKLVQSSMTVNRWLGSLAFVVSLLLHTGLMLMPVASESQTQDVEPEKPQEQVKVVKAKTLAPPLPKEQVKRTPLPRKPPPQPQPVAPRPKPRPQPRPVARVNPPPQRQVQAAKPKLDNAQRQGEEEKRQKTEAARKQAEERRKQEAEAQQRAEEEKKRQAEEEGKRLQAERLARLNAARESILASTTGEADLNDASRQLSIPPDPSWFSDPALYFTQESIDAVVADPTERLVNLEHVLAATIYERTPETSYQAYKGDSNWQALTLMGNFGGGKLYKGKYQELELFINIIKREVKGGVPSTVEVLMSQDPTQL